MTSIGKGPPRPRSAAAPVSEAELWAAYRGSTSEDQLLSALIEAATLYGWRWHHVRRSDKALQMGHAGFPDLILVRRGRILALELKSAKGYATPEQDAWIQAFRDAGAFAMVVTPAHLDTILEALR